VHLVGFTIETHHGYTNMRLLFCALPVVREWKDFVAIIKYYKTAKQRLFSIFFLLSDSSSSEFYVPTFRSNIFRLHRSLFTRVVKMDHIQRPLKMEQTVCSETSAHKYQTPGNHPKERIQLSQHGESTKSRKIFSLL
jgi:hypothetical protein